MEEKRAIGENFLQGEKLTQRQRPREGAALIIVLGAAGPGWVTWAGGSNSGAHPMPLEYVLLAASLASFLFVEPSSRPVLDAAAVPNGLLQMI